MQYVRYNTLTKDINDNGIISDMQYAVDFPCGENEVWKDLNSPEVIEVFEKREAERVQKEKEEKLLALQTQFPELYTFINENQVKTNEVLDTLILEALNV